MGITNYEHNLKTLELAIKNGYGNFQLNLKKISTGSYEYYIGAWLREGTLTYHVEIQRPNGKEIGAIDNIRVSYHGLEYTNTAKSLPDSVVKFIVSFNRDICNRI